MMAFGMEDDLATTVQGMEFISWLREQHPELDISANVPTDKLRDLATTFCIARSYPNATQFADDLLRWLGGRGSSKVLAELQQLGVDAKSRNKNSRADVSPFARYNNVPYHGIFLFLAASDFPGFIQDHWVDLNSLTGDLLDVYYSAEDLARRVSAYDTLEQFRSLKVDRTALPALLLWKAELVDCCVIPLQSLSHDDIITVVALIVQRIDEDKELAEIYVEASAKVQSISNAKLPHIEMGPNGSLVIVGNVTGNRGNIAIGSHINVGEAISPKQPRRRAPK